MADNFFTAGDERRAESLILHHHGLDAEGLNSILRQAVDKQRVWQLLVTVLRVYEQWIPRLFNERGLALDTLVEQVSAIAGGDVAPPAVATDLSDEDLKAAAVVILEDRVRNGERLQEVVLGRPNVSAVICGVMSLYSVLVPATNTQAALELLREAALRAAQLEEAEGE